MSRNGTSPEPSLRSWRVTLIRQNDKWMGTVEAPDAETAIQIAAEQFNAREAQRSRLIAMAVE